MGTGTKIQGNVIRSLTKPLLIGMICGVITISVLLLGAALVLLKLGQIQPTVVQGVVISISAVSAFLSGWIAGRVARRNGLFLGSLTGLLLYFLFLIVSVACGVFIMFAASSAIRFVVMVLSGAIGGLISVNHRQKSK